MHGSQKHSLQPPYEPKCAVFHPKTAINGFFWSKVELFGFRLAVEAPLPLILGVLDEQRQAFETHRSQKHNLPQPYAPKCAIPHQKNVNYTRTPKVKNFFVNIICGLNDPNAHFR